ncbi:hypothetical protein GOP47_0016548 [Adiantum capillus-veneris]|uniref:Uncharacterized protein n=1 Tax=Adiantum capillus-veneris TaxID=13818 RepID=A0A9D4UHV4_ADICA|nr:hypothetical protein GOP47_0016548 [Adiantum capillus-veneris]
MASLSSGPCYTSEAPRGGERSPCVCAPSQAVALSSRVTRRERELRISSFAQIRVLSTGRSKLPLLQVAARRSSQRQKPVVEQREPLDDDESAYGEYVKPDLPGQEPDFWEGPQFELLGFVVQYLWAFGVLIALIGCFAAVRFYNYGAADFKGTEVYKDAMESQGFVETPSDSKVFEEPPPQDAPSVVQESSS